MAKKLAVIFGIVFALVGILGFFPNSIVGYATSTGSPIFLTDVIHNIVHLLIGIILLIAAGKGMRASSMALKVFGVVYIILFIDGLIETNKLLGFITQNSNDTWLHLVLGVVLLVVGFSSASSNTMVMDKSTM
jgi:hypothetical protein